MIKALVDKVGLKRYMAYSYGLALLLVTGMAITSIVLGEFADSKNIVKIKHFERFLHVGLLLMVPFEIFFIFRPMMRAAEYAQSRLIHLNRMKSEFLANMSHEIRTPINAVFGIGELLLQSNMSVKQRNQVETLMASADGLLAIIDDILDFSKIEAGRLEVESVAFDLHSAIDDVAELLAIRAREKRLEIIVRYMPGTPQFVMGDPGRIRQILMNLIGNAIKFTEAGYVLITAEMAPAGEGATPKLKVRVEDTGIGIAPSKQATIFDIFAQADGSTTRKYGGTGLGLTITRQLVELMGGEIRVESQEGKGSQFSFTLNLSKAERPSKFEPSRTVLVGKRVLIVDDIEANRDVLMDNLVQSGMQVVCAESGKEGLRALRNSVAERRPFDMLLVDYLMPEMNGDTFVRSIRNDPAISNVPIIVLSSTEERGFIKIFSTMKVAAYLSKPVRREQLIDMMAMVLEAQARGQPFDMLTTHTTHAMRSVGSNNQAQLLNGTRILLTEDNRINLEFTTEMLVGMGCIVEHAIHGKMAIEKIQQQPFDIVLMDCQMPVMDGFEASQHIQAMQQRGEVAQIPIIALTANAMDGDRERCLKSGMQDYLSKPVRRANLESMLLRWVKNSGQGFALSVPGPVMHEHQETPAVGIASFSASQSKDGVVTIGAIDREAWAETRSLVGDRIDIISGYFLEDGERYIREIQAALQSGRALKEFVMPAHTLKSSARQFGLLGLADLARRIEEIGRTQSDMNSAAAAIQPLIAPLQQAFDEASAYLQSQRKAS